MPYPSEGADEWPDPLHDEHVAFPDALAPHPAGPPLPDSAWAPAARTSPVGAPPSGPAPTAEPASPAPSWAPGRRAPTPNRRRRVLRTLVVVWIGFAVFGNHDYHSSDSSSGTSVEMGGGMGSGLGAPADGHDPSVVLPVNTGVEPLPAEVQQFRVEVASPKGEVTVAQSTRRASAKQVATGSWTGDVTPSAGYPAPQGPVGQQSSEGPVNPKVSGIVTATAADATSIVQCRVYADDELVLIATGPGTVTCRVPAVDGATG
ncbi:MAG: hypothetical protein L0H96_04345 [Humibacillus sp.]|nr:hypothetical protein [Humibacillus sp.]MDN5776120.1 hypothetical protein [Humibacillus sp.]